jgi:hypothetical protein
VLSKKFVPTIDPAHKQCHAAYLTNDEERKKSNTLPHRRHDLETAIANLQLGPLAPRVHGIIDRYNAALPGPDKRNKHELTWQLALHRMDFRQYDLAQPAAGETSAPDRLQLFEELHPPRTQASGS